MPETAVRGFTPIRFAGRSSLGPLRSGADTLLSLSRWRPIACCYSVSHRRSDQARLVALSSFSSDEVTVLSSWERLVERTCLRAAGDGKLRVLARPPEGSNAAHILSRLGFTAVTGERVLVAACASGSSDHPPGFAPLRGNDAWDAWKLYSQTEPSTVQRAEGLTPASWWKGRRLRRRPYQEWILREDGNVVVHLELMYGHDSAALSLHYHPAYRDALPLAVEHALGVCGQRGIRKLYCTVRDHQAELEGLLCHGGFELARSQTRLVLYTSVLSYAQEAHSLPAMDRASPVFGVGISPLTNGCDDEQGR